MVNKKKKLNIIITNSFQNDFIEPIDDLANSQEQNGLKLDFEMCQDKWIEYFGNQNRTVDEATIMEFISWLKSNTQSQNIDTPVSYHKILEKYKHRVHINFEESKRLWKEGRLNQFIIDLMKRASEENNNESGEAEYQFIHLRDWHDQTDVSQRGELDHFGVHCLKGTYGSKFTNPLDDQINKHPEFNVVLNSNSISSFEETDLEYVLNTIIKNAGSSKKDVNIGVFGVITNVKVQLLVYELKIIHNIQNVYVCKDFCAAFNNRGHLSGIDAITAIYAANVADETKFREIFNI